MGVFRYRIRIAARPEGPYEEIEPLVDTSSMYTFVPSAIISRLGLTSTDTRPFQLADGRIIERNVVEAVVQIDGRRAHTICVIGGERDQVLLGAYTLEGLALAVDPVNERLVPMPAIPAVSATPR